jgi:hypothetical protein
MSTVKKVDQRVNNPGMVRNTTDVMEQNSNIGEAFSWAEAIRASVKGAGKGEMRGGTNLKKAACKGTGRGK